ncbi:hypothetical protein L2E82_26868 [Cichorium intybus]|uniref:Uncharacterized protein n=1 Tax=Cichorium intybus TaxID=13427 RepID=A0ACB9CRM9_CICIN|nr:hypothetical protein L2E82_26868 [Cichorium intybus]
MSSSVRPSLTLVYPTHTLSPVGLFLYLYPSRHFSSVLRAQHAYTRFPSLFGNSLIVFPYTKSTDTRLNSILARVAMMSSKLVLLVASDS